MAELLSIQQQQVTAVAELEAGSTDIPTQPIVHPTETRLTLTIVSEKSGTPTLTPAVTSTPTPTLDLLATVAGGRSYQIQENTPQPMELLAANITRADYVILQQSTPSKGKLEPSSSGPYLYRPTPNYFGPDSFIYQVCLLEDGSVCVTNSVTINIEGVNDLPEADDDQISLREDDGIQTLTSTLLDGDSDKDGDPLTIEGVMDNSGQAIFIPATANSASAVRYDLRDSYNYLAEGETASETFQYTIVDPSGGRSIGNVTVQIEGINDAPVANDDLIANGTDIVVSAEDIGDFPVSLLLFNDTDPDESDLEKLVLNTVENDLAGGSVVKLDGAWRFDPKEAYISLPENETAVETIIYTIIDPQGAISRPATAQIKVRGVNDPPVLDLLTLNPLTIPPVVSPTVTSTINSQIVSNVTITDTDSHSISRILIRYAGNFTRPDNADEHVSVTFEGNSLISNDDFIEISTDLSFQSVIDILKSTRYVNAALDPAAACRRIDFQIFDEYGAGSNIVSLLIEVGGSSCQTGDKAGQQLTRFEIQKRGLS